MNIFLVAEDGVHQLTCVEENPYTNSNVGTESYLLELGYISNKDDLFKRIFYNTFPITTAVSHIRFEKPHSLSYHAVT